MIITEIIGNIKDLSKADLQQYHIEKVYLDNESLAKRIHHVKTDHDNEVHVRLAAKHHLRVGDILYQDAQRIVVVEVLSEDVLIIQPTTIYDMGVIAHALGNRHLPAQFEGDIMLVQYDYLVERLLGEMGYNYRREERYVEEPFRHIGHSHDE
jgi:Urease accessory protein UreE